MKLSYRGVHYEAPLTAVEGVERGITGNYRGQTVHFTYPRHIPVQPILDLKYRGTAYRTTASGGVEAGIADAIQVASPNGLETRPALATIPAAMSRHAKMDEVNRVHRDNIYRQLQHRIDVARARGDQSLIQLLEREMQQIM